MKNPTLFSSLILPDLSYTSPSSPIAYNLPPTTLALLFPSEISFYCYLSSP